VAQDLIDIVSVAESFSLVLVQELGQQVLGVGGHREAVLFLRRPSDGPRLNQEVHFVLVLIVERRNAHDHLIDEDAEGPPVQGHTVAGSVDHLRGCRGIIEKK
jgi:hypothetical protein